MKQTLSTTGRAGRGIRSRLATTLAMGIIVAGCWLVPALAQEHAAPAPDTHQPAQTQPGHAPAEPGHTPAPGSTTAEPGHAPTTEHTGETPPVGTQPHAPQGHAAEEGHGEAGHGEGHGEGEGEEGHHGTHIEPPSLIIGPLKQFWYAGPATVNAMGAVDSSGNLIKSESFKGQTFTYKHTDHEHPAHHKPVYTVQATLGEIGGGRPGPGAETQTVTIGGQEITLVSPTAKFARQSMLPELLVMSLLTIVGVVLVSFLLTRKMERVPGKRQMLVEIIYGALDHFVQGLIPGPNYKRYVPLIGTIFIYVMVMNYAGLLPGWKSPTANLNVTAGLAIVVIPFVQFEGIRANGLKGYFMHFVGEPVWLAPLNFPLHIIGEVARVLSLSVRLFGNIFGEDIVLAILILLAGMFGMNGLIPFQFPMVLFALFTGFVQAMVFSMLTGVYISLMTTHEDHGHGHGHGHELAHGHA